MIALTILGLNWCQHAGWKIVLYEQGRGRRLQVTLTPEDAVVVGHELAQHASERAGLYSLVGALLRQQPHRTSVVLKLSESNRARTTLVVHADEGEKSYVTSAADGVALAVRARLPILADEALLDAFGVEDEAGAELPTEASAATPIPEAFRHALDGPGASG
jgi:bifunctional DNase/RNase